jgi:hypothetical protein
MTELLKGNYPMDPPSKEKEAWAERFSDRKKERTLV